MMNKLLTCIFLIGVVFTSCHSKKEFLLDMPNEKIETIVGNNHRIKIDVSKVDSVIVILDNNQTKTVIMSDFKILEQTISNAIYDTRLNSGDIMIKMQAPDYTVVIYYADKSRDDSDWLMVWTEGARIKYKEHWYLLTEDQKCILDKLLEGYK